MSRTKRKTLDGEYIIRGEIIRWQDMDWGSPDYPYGMGFTCRYRIMETRDNKPWSKPPKWYKQINRRAERARVNTAMRSGKEPPLFKKGDAWDWT